VRGAGANQAESGSYGLNKTSANSELVIQLLVETEFLHARQKKIRQLCVFRGKMTNCQFPLENPSPALQFPRRRELFARWEKRHSETHFSSLRCKQGDQIGRIFALCLIVFLWQFFLKNFRSCPHFWATFFYD
jgi:hypothetical protein